MPEIHPLADVKSTDIWPGTRVWQYCIVFRGASIGDNCNLCAHTLIEADVVIGNNVTIKSGVFLWDGTRVEDNVFISPNATFTNDRMPRSKVYPESLHGILVKQGAGIGANAMVGAGAVVTADVPDNAVVVGNPARVVRPLGQPAPARTGDG